MAPRILSELLKGLTAALLAGVLSAGVAAVAGALVPPEEPEGAAGPAGGASRQAPVVEEREGFLVNFVHRYYFPVAAWRMAGPQEADLQQLEHASLPGVLAKVLVSPGSTVPVEEAISALREKAAEDGRTHVLQESRVKVGMKEAGDLVVVREAAGQEPLTIIRTVCFNRGESKFYVRLEAPASCYEEASRDFDRIISGFKFEMRLKMPWSK